MHLPNNAIYIYTFLVDPSSCEQDFSMTFLRPFKCCRGSDPIPGQPGKPKQNYQRRKLRTNEIQGKGSFMLMTNIHGK